MWSLLRACNLSWKGSRYSWQSAISATRLRIANERAFDRILSFRSKFAFAWNVSTTLCTFSTPVLLVFCIGYDVRTEGRAFLTGWLISGARFLIANERAFDRPCSILSKSALVCNVSTPFWRSSPSAISDGVGYLSAEGRGVFTGSFVSGMRVLFSYVLILLSRDSMWVKGKG